MDPINVDKLETVELASSTSNDAEWVGGYFAYGGSGADKSATVYFAVRLASGSGATPTPRRRRSSSSVAAATSFAMKVPRRSGPETSSCCRRERLTISRTPVPRISA